MISHKTRQLYGSILLVLLVIIYYYYTRMHEGFGKKKSSSPSTPTTAPPPPRPTTAQPPPMPSRFGKPVTATQAGKPAITIQGGRPVTAGKPVQAAPINVSKQVEQIKDSYLEYYKLMSDKDKQKLKKVYSHFIENVVKDEFPPFS